LIRDRLMISRQTRKLAELESSLAEYQQKIGNLQKEVANQANAPETPPAKGG